MRPDQFEKQMKRLIAQFGKANYSEERVTLIYQAVSQYSPDWWAKTVDKFLGDCRVAPLMPEIREEIAIERNRAYERQKTQDRHETVDAMRRFGATEITEILNGLRERLHGRLSDESFDGFNRVIANAAKHTVTCRVCSDEGVFVAVSKNESRTRYAFRCYCDTGRNDHRNITPWQPDFADRFEIGA